MDRYIKLRPMQELRRGGISYERADKNAIYVRALGDGKMKGKTTLADSGQLLEWELKLLEKMTLPENKLRIRSRFLSLHRIHRTRRPAMKLSKENRQDIDDFYYHPAQLLLRHIGDWDFNVFHLDTLSGGRTLVFLAYHIFREHGFIQRFRIDTIKLLRFITLVEDSYHESNPYHNVIHATDVTQAMYCYLQQDKLRNTVTKFEAMMAVVAAMAHDLDHPGVNQTFLVATANHLAALYQNTSVLEMHHWRYGVGLMQESGLFSHFSSTQWATALWQFRSLILATDITRQQEFLIKFRRMIDEQESAYESNLQSRHFVLQIALKCADICNPCRHWPISERWSRQVCEEFFRQGDMERQVGVPVTPVCDRQANTVAKIQIGFMEVVVRPLFMEWKRFMPSNLSHKMLGNILKNKQHWQAIIEKDQSLRPVAVVASSSGSRNTSHNNATILVAGLDNKEDEEEVPQVEEEEFVEEEVGSGEEADIVENDVNLAFHYQTDWEQMSDGSQSLPPVSEEEQLMMLARISRRRHSMPVVVRKDLAFYMGLRRDSFTRSNFQRRQSLPANPSGNSSSLFARARAGTGDQGQKLLSMEGLMVRPKISSLSSTLDAHLDHLLFLPLSSQTHLMQMLGPACVESTTTQEPSTSSGGELRHRSILPKEAEKLLRSGLGVCRKQLVGLASSWPSILRGGHKVDPNNLQLLASCTGIASEGDAHTTTNPPENNVGVSVCLSAAQTEGVSLLSRPH